MLRPDYTRVVCGCARDCGARCIGAYGDPGSEPNYCDPAHPPPPGANCVWRPGPSLGLMFETIPKGSSYNELVIDGTYWSAHVPEAIEAVFGPDAGAHAALMRDFPYLNIHDVPKLGLSVDDWQNPFR